MSALTAESFELLLSRFERDEKLFPSAASAGEKYLLLREKLVKCLTWKNCPESEADALADSALDRVVRKLAEGEEIENMKAYACEVLRYVWLEHLRKRGGTEIAPGDDKMPEGETKSHEDILDEDERSRCLRTCLAKLEPSAEAGKTAPQISNAELITRYYDVEAGEKLWQVRKQLAVDLDFPMTISDYRIQLKNPLGEPAEPDAVGVALENLEAAIDAATLENQKRSAIRTIIEESTRDIKSEAKIIPVIERVVEDLQKRASLTSSFEVTVAAIQKKSMTRLKVRAFRLREQLEKCINDCVKRLTSVTKTPNSDTNNRGGSAK